jgi:hypothetical protein
MENKISFAGSSPASGAKNIMLDKFMRMNAFLVWKR